MTRVLLPIIALSLAAALGACGSSEVPADDNDAGSSGQPPPSGGSTGSGGTSGTAPTTEPPPPPPPQRPYDRPLHRDGRHGHGVERAAQLKVANAISAKCKKDGCDFITLLGDNLYPTGASSVDDPIWQSAFETPYAAIDLPFYAVLGNHDYGSDGLGLEFGKGANEIAYAAKSKKWKMPAAHYNLPVKDVLELFALDTNLIFLNQNGGAQKTALEGWLAASKAPWKIALGHHPSSRTARMATRDATTASRSVRRRARRSSRGWKTISAGRSTSISAATTTAASG